MREAGGLRLIAVDVKDVMFPGELKKIFAQLVGESSGNTVVLGMPAMGVPIPVSVPERGSPGSETSG